MPDVHSRVKGATVIRITSIQYLRGIAALMVLLHHTAFKLSRIGPNVLSWLRCGDAGVDVFFLVSGFVMCHSVRDSHQRPGAISGFLRGRLLRILPLYWLVSCVALAVYLVNPALVNSSGGVTNIPLSFLLLPTADRYLVENGWTLSYEFYFYFVFSIGLLWPRATGRAIVIGALVALASLGFVLKPASAWGSLLTSSLLLEFVAGMLLYRVFESGRRLPSIPRWACLAAAAFTFALVNGGHGVGVRVLDYGVPAALLCVGVVLGPARAGPPHRLWHGLGDISYSLYLVHPFSVALVAVAFRLLAWPALLGVPAGLCMVGISLAASALVYRYVERPLHQRSRPAR